jgi:FAD/FMN-containing dehydrogenase
MSGEGKDVLSHLFLLNSWVFSVPVSRLPDLVYETRKDLDKIGLKCMVCGHVGDGNFHAVSSLLSYLHISIH